MMWFILGVHGGVYLMIAFFVFGEVDFATPLTFGLLAKVIFFYYWHQFACEVITAYERKQYAYSE